MTYSKKLSWLKIFVNFVFEKFTKIESAKNQLNAAKIVKNQNSSNLQIHKILGHNNICYTILKYVFTCPHSP